MITCAKVSSAHLKFFLLPVVCVLRIFMTSSLFLRSDDVRDTVFNAVLIYVQTILQLASQSVGCITAPAQ